GPGAGCRGRRRRTSQQLLYQFAPPRRATGRTRPPRRETRRLKPGEGGGVMTAQMLAGRVALVTGGARGIGLACATALGRTGAAVVITDRLDRGGEGIGGAHVWTPVTL